MKTARRKTPGVRETGEWVDFRLSACICMVCIINFVCHLPRTLEESVSV